MDFAHSLEEVESPTLDTRKQSCIGLSSFPLEYLDKFTSMGYAKEEVFHAFAEVSKASPNQEASSLWPAVLCCLKEKRVYGSQTESRATSTRYSAQTSTTNIRNDAALLRCQVNQTSGGEFLKDSASLRPCSSSDHQVQISFPCSSKAKGNAMRMPPLNSWEKFEETYEVILILDNREQFARGSKSGKLVDNIGSQFDIKIEVKFLPVGDAIWIARHRQLSTEYVLDFIVERKKVDDLRQSIRDNRYRDQKLRLLVDGLEEIMAQSETGYLETPAKSMTAAHSVSRTSNKPKTLQEEPDSKLTTKSCRGTRKVEGETDTAPQSACPRVPMAAQSAQINVESSTAERGYNTRRSTRLLEKQMCQLSLKDSEDLVGLLCNWIFFLISKPLDWI